MSGGSQSCSYFWALRYNTRHAAFRKFLAEPGVQNVAKFQQNGKRYLLVDTERLPQALRIVVRKHAGQDEEGWAEDLQDHVATQNLIAMALVFTGIIAIIPFLNEVKVSNPE